MRRLAISSLFTLNIIREFFDQIKKLIWVISFTKYKYSQISRKSPEKINFMFVTIVGKLSQQMSHNIFIEKEPGYNCEHQTYSNSKQSHF